MSPEQRLKRSSIIHPDRPDLDRTKPGAGNPRGDRKRGVEILGLDQIVSAELLAGLRERAIGGQRFAFTHPHRGRGRGRLQPVAGLEIAALNDGLGEGAYSSSIFLAVDGSILPYSASFW